MNIIEQIRRWYWKEQPVKEAIKKSKVKAGVVLKGTPLKDYWVYDGDICPKNDYKNHVKGDTCCLFGYCQNIITNEIDALYHCKYCQTIMHFPLNKNPNEKDLYDKRKIQTKNFRKPIKI